MRLFKKKPFKTKWMNKKAKELVKVCKKDGLFRNYDIIETLQTLEVWAIKFRGSYSFKKDYVGPKGFLTKLIPKMWWNRGAWLHDGWFEYMSLVGEFGIFNFKNANTFFDICNKVNTPTDKGRCSKVLNKIAYFAVSALGRFAMKSKK